MKRERQSLRVKDGRNKIGGDAGVEEASDSVMMRA
jgi:hypothetical protein